MRSVLLAIKSNEQASACERTSCLGPNTHTHAHTDAHTHIRRIYIKTTSSKKSRSQKAPKKNEVKNEAEKAKAVEKFTYCARA